MLLHRTRTVQKVCKLEWCVWLLWSTQVQSVGFMKTQNFRWSWLATINETFTIIP